MSTRNNSLTSEQRRTEESLKVERLRVSLKYGIAALDRGEFTELEDDDLDDYVDEIGVPHASR